jgi:hypothetical protein
MNALVLPLALFGGLVVWTVLRLRVLQHPPAQTTAGSGTRYVYGRPV